MFLAHPNRTEPNSPFKVEEAVAVTIDARTVLFSDDDVVVASVVLC